VLVAAALGLLAPGPGRDLARHDAINVVLAVLVFSAALTVPARIGERLQRNGLRLLAVTVASSAVVVGIAWAVSHLVAAGPLRLGVLAVGVAPVEIATLGVAPLGRGDSLASGVLLVGSTLLTALFAGPAVALLAGGTSVHVGNLVVTLLVVVVAPFVVGLAIRSRVGALVRGRASTAAAGAGNQLVWLCLL
jgi:predicted Na+-dependent transporter